jgi:hypothetical protein
MWFRVWTGVAMDENNDNNLYSGFGDDGTFVPFTDIVLNVLLGFTFLVLIALALVRPEAKAGSVEVKAEVLITVSWPDGAEDDVDVYVKDPIGNIVWFFGKEKGLLNLERDDRGAFHDTIVVNGVRIANPLNQETVTLRGIVAGEYVVNIYDYTGVTQGKLPVSVRVEKLNPKVSVIFYGVHDFTHTKEEATMVRFTLNADGNVTDMNARPESLVQQVNARK